MTELIGNEHVYVPISYSIFTVKGWASQKIMTNMKYIIQKYFHDGGLFFITVNKIIYMVSVGHGC